MTTAPNNQVLLEGIPLNAPQWSHENHGISFYRLMLRVPRLSGAADTLPLLFPQALCTQVTVGQPLRINGQLRSFNNRSGIGNKLVLTVYALSLQPGTGEPCNTITLSGAICKPPIFRRTPLGRSICDLMLAVPRHYGRADYLPVIAWGQLALRTSLLHLGDPIRLEGRVQSRVYHKVISEELTQERVAYEVSVMHLLDEED